MILDPVSVGSSDSSDAELLQNTSLTPIVLQHHTQTSNDNASSQDDREACDDNASSLCNAIVAFKESTITSSPCQLFSVSRTEGTEQLKLDILGAYKNPNTGLKAKPRVCFERSCERISFQCC